MLIFQKFDEDEKIHMMLDFISYDWLIHETAQDGIICITRYIHELEQWTQHYIAYTYEKGWVICDDKSLILSSFSLNIEEIRNQAPIFYQFLAEHGFDINDTNFLLPDVENHTQNPVLMELSNFSPVFEKVFYENDWVDYPALVFKKINTLTEASRQLELTECNWLISEGSTPGIINIYTKDSCHYFGFTTEGWLLLSKEKLKFNLLNLRPREMSLNAQGFIEKLAEIGFDIFDVDLLLPSLEQVTTNISLQELQQLPQASKTLTYSKFPLLFFNQEIDDIKKPYIFKRFYGLDEPTELLKSSGKLWLLRETNIPGIIAIHRYIPETDTYVCRRYACTGKEWILVGNDLDALERHLIVLDISMIENHEQNFYECLAQDGFIVEDENFLTPHENMATQSKNLKSLSLYPFMTQQLLAYP